MGNWENYLMWQFSSSSNCGRTSCPMRIDGTESDIDVNTVPMTREALKAVWKQGDLLPVLPPEYQYLVSVSGALGTSTIPRGHAVAEADVRRRPQELTALNYQDF